MRWPPVATQLSEADEFPCGEWAGVQFNRKTKETQLRTAPTPPSKWHCNRVNPLEYCGVDRLMRYRYHAQNLPTGRLFLWLETI